jgi:hypothetical protein
VTCVCGNRTRVRYRDVVDPVTHHIVARGAMCNPCFDRAIRAGARLRRRHDRRARGLSRLGRVVVGVSSVLASMAAVGCALDGRVWLGVASVVVAAWFAGCVWRDDVRRTR